MERCDEFKSFGSKKIASDGGIAYPQASKQPFRGSP